MHWLDKQLIVSVIQNNKLSFYSVNSENMSLEDKQSPELDDCESFDHLFIHRQSFLIHNRLYLLKNVVS